MLESAKKLSVITTLFNSERDINQFYKALLSEIQEVTENYEIIFVDDGSSDQSLQIALDIVANNEKVSVLELSKNFGHHKAIFTGLQYSSGELVFLIDVDLEESPKLLKTFLIAMNKEFSDVVFGVQDKREGGFIKRVLGGLGWKIIDYLYTVKIPKNQCTVRLMNRNFVDALMQYREANLVFGGITSLMGFKQVGVKISKVDRNKSSYSFRNRLSVLVDGVTSFSDKPLNFMVVFGVFMMFTNTLVGMYLIFQKIFFNAAVGWSSLMVSIWFLNGMVMLCLGIIGIYIAKIFIESKKRPLTIVRTKYGKINELK
jgi:putative glycosyltransferase